MDLSQFEDFLDRHGADLAAWPAPSRLGATALMANSAAARAAFRAAGDVEAFLRHPRAEGSLVADAIAARAMQHRQVRPVPLAARRAGWVTAAAAALVLGLFVGDVMPRHDESPDSVVSAALDSTGSADVD